MASTIGLIALTGMSKQMALIAQQQNQINKERELASFWNRIEGTENNKKDFDCGNTIREWLGSTPAPKDAEKEKLAEGTKDNDIQFKVLKDKNDDNLIDVDDSNNIFSRYGFTPRFFVLRCDEPDPDGSGPKTGSCDCRSSATPTPTYPCTKTWRLIPGIQDGLTFIYGRHFNMDITWKHPGPPSSWANFDETKFIDSTVTCDEPRPAGQAGGGGSTDFSCEEADSDTGADNICIGKNAGKGATITGGGNAFIGYKAGEGAEVRPYKAAVDDPLGRATQDSIASWRGEGNLFLGARAGKNRILMGKYNTYIGYRAGEDRSQSPVVLSGIGQTWIGGTKLLINAHSVHIPGIICPPENFLTIKNSPTLGVGELKCVPIGSHSGDAPSEHTHPGYAPSEHAHPAGSHTHPAGSHPHPGYAPSEHTHPGYAPSEHTHPVQSTSCGSGQVYNYRTRSCQTRTCTTQERWSGTQCVPRCLFTWDHWLGGDSCVHRCGEDSNQIWDESSNRCRTCGPHEYKLANRCLVLCKVGQRWSGAEGCKPINPSSKTLKKNIRPFNDMEKALKDILETPLFTYHFKAKGDHPDKKRMGIIAEDLPKSLQLKEKPIRPDWPSIYGTLWAGIKALHNKFESLSQTDKELKAQDKAHTEEIEALKQENKSLKKRLDQIEKEFKRFKKQD